MTSGRSAGGAQGVQVLARHARGRAQQDEVAGALPVEHRGVAEAPHVGEGRGTAAALGIAALQIGEGVVIVSGVSELSDASLSFSSLEGWRERGAIREFLQLTSDVWRVRGFGDFWSYMLVAEGAVDIAAEPELELHDMAALVPIVREAGGRFTSLDGEDGPFGGHALATNGLLHDDVLARLRTGDETEDGA